MPGASTACAKRSRRSASTAQTADESHDQPAPAGSADSRPAASATARPAATTPAAITSRQRRRSGRQPRRGSRSRQSPSAACHSVSAATAAVSARRMRGPRLAAPPAASPRSRAALGVRKPALRPDQDRPGPAARAAPARRRRPSDARRTTGACRSGGPGRQQPVQRLQIGHLGHEGAAALLGRLDRMGLQPVLPDAFGIGDARVCTGRIRATPSSTAFSTMKSVRAFLIGANSSHRSGGMLLAAASAPRRPARRRACPPRPPARHSPSRPLNSSTPAPTPSRITVNR